MVANLGVEPQAAGRPGAARARRWPPRPPQGDGEGEPDGEPRTASRATPATGGRADGRARVGHGRPGPLALHRLPPRPLLGRDRRRLPRRAASARSCSACWSAASTSRATTTRICSPPLEAHPGRDHRPRRRLLHRDAPGAPRREAPRAAAVAAPRRADRDGAAVPSASRAYVRAVAEARFEIAPYDFAAAARLTRRARRLARHVAQILVRRGLRGPRGRAARSWPPTCGTRWSAFGGLRGGGGGRARPRARGLADHRARRLRRRRRVLDGDPRAGAAHARRARGLVPAVPHGGRLRAAAGDGRPAGRARDASCWSPRTARSPRWTRSPRPATSGMDVVVTDHHAPRADGRLPDARRSCTRGLGGGNPCGDLCAAGVAYKLAGALLDGRRGTTRRWPTRTSTWSRSPPSPTSSRCTTRTARSCAPGCGRCGRTQQARPARADGRRAGGPERGSTRRRSASGSAPRINAAGRGSRAPTPALELLLTEDDDRARAVAEELDRLNQRAPRRGDADPVRGGGAGPRGGRRARLRARRRGLAPGRDRHRRLAHRRAPHAARRS